MYKEFYSDLLQRNFENFHKIFTETSLKTS